MLNSSLLRALARSFLAGEFAVDAIRERATHTLGRSWPWLLPLAGRYVDKFAGGTRPRLREVFQFLVQDAGFQRVLTRRTQKLSVSRWLTVPQRMQPVTAAITWELPKIESIGDLCAWLRLTPTELDWFADLKGLTQRKVSPLLSHYHYRVLSKASGGIRLIEAPKPRLKQLQRQILTGILDRIPPHPAVHGFIKSRSIKTFAAPHLSQRIVLKMDLQDYFPSFAAARIQTFFRTAGYPESVADLLGGICTNAAPRSLGNRELYGKPHLPQGAPTSPALANLCTYRADCRLAGLAESAGAFYTRYADDLAFSGSDAFERRAERFSVRAAAILLEEGLQVHHRKTRIMRQGVRQHLAGMVINRHMNVTRPDFDALKATLTNCVRQGPSLQNRAAHADFRAHLNGRIAFVAMVNPAKGKRLRAIFERIQWT